MRTPTAGSKNKEELTRDYGVLLELKKAVHFDPSNLENLPRFPCAEKRRKNISDYDAVEILNVNTIRKLKPDELSYVIKTDGKLFLANRDYDHSDVAKGDDVLAAGEVVLNCKYGETEAKIVNINNASGSYMREIFLFNNYDKLVSHFSKMIEYIFKINGFYEVEGKYHHWKIQEKEYKKLINADKSELDSYEKAFLKMMKLKRNT